MAKRKKYYHHTMRNPKTTQERKANIDNPYVRGKRRKLPDAWNQEKCINHQKSWKAKGRKQQYREGDLGYSWHEFKYEWHERELGMSVAQWLDGLQCFYEWTGGGIRWFGPPWIRKGYCPCCYTRLIEDYLSGLYGKWCPNEECSFIQERKKWST